MKKKYKNLSRHIGRNQFMPTIGHRGVAMLDFPRTPKIFQKRTHLTHNSYMGMMPNWAKVIRKINVKGCKY